MANIIRKILDGFKIARFIRNVRADMQMYNGKLGAARLLDSIKEHKEELPKSLTAKHEAEITAVLQELSDLPLTEIEGLVRKHLKS